MISSRNRKAAQSHLSSSASARTLLRSGLGNIFGAVYVNPNYISRFSSKLPSNNANNNQTINNKLISFIDFDQPAIITSMDSGEIPGVYSTALLQNDSIHLVNRFTLKPVDWITLMMNNSSFANAFSDLIDHLESHHQHHQSLLKSNNINNAEVFLCPLSLSQNAENIDESPSSTISKNKNDWTSTQIIQWRVRCFAIAVHLAYMHSMSSLSSSSSSKKVVVPPSLQWMKKIIDDEAVKNIDFPESLSSSSLLRQSYNQLLKLNAIGSSYDDGMYFMLPPLESIILGWEIVQKYGFALVTKENSSLYPTLAPILSSHLLLQRSETANETETKIMVNKGTNLKTSSSSTGWSGMKGVKKKNTTISQQNNTSIYSNNNNIINFKARVLSIPQIVKEKELVKNICDRNNDDMLMYAGTRCKKYNLPIDELGEGKGKEAGVMKNQQEGASESSMMINQVGSEKWFLVIEEE